MSGGKAKEKTTCFKNQRCWETSIVSRPLIFLIRLAVFKEKKENHSLSEYLPHHYDSSSKNLCLPTWSSVTKLDKSITETMPSCFPSFLNRSEWYKFFVIAKTPHSSLSIPIQQGKLRGLQIVNNKALKIETPDVLKKTKQLNYRIYSNWIILCNSEIIF